ncbi:hypothetical protein K4B79_35580 [Streptomyces lincolnensis]|nr:hypothetical protein [Streptomyces lincolnensis]
MTVAKPVWVPGVTAGTVGADGPRCVDEAPGVDEAVAAVSPAGRPAGETAAAPVPRPTALPKVRLLNM